MSALYVSHAQKFENSIEQHRARLLVTILVVAVNTIKKLFILLTCLIFSPLLSVSNSVVFYLGSFDFFFSVSKRSPLAKVHMLIAHQNVELHARHA